jgi:hypothetical protein
MGGRANANLHLNYPAGLRGTSLQAKVVYTRLLSDDALNHAGVLPLRVPLWADECEMSEDGVKNALLELETKRFAYTDWKTHQVLVRTLIRNDGIADMPNVLWSACRCALNLRSEKLRRVLAGELRKLAPQPPDKVNEKTGKRYVYPDPHGTADKIDPGPPSDGEGSSEPLGTLLNPSQGSPTPGGGGGGGGRSPVGTSSSSKKAPRKRGAKVTDDPTAKTAHEITTSYAERVGPMVNFPAVLGIVRKAVRAEHTADGILAALIRLADANRPITTDTLRIELGKGDGGRRDVWTVPDDELTADDVEEILGPGRPPEPPDEFEFWDRDRRHAWNRENYRRWQAARREQAIRSRAERLARVTRLADHRRDTG